MSFIFDANEDPKQRMLRKNAAVAQALRAGAAQPATDLGSGIAAMGNALAYRAMKPQQQQAAADPWAGMRQTTGATPMSFIRGLFGG